MRLIRLACLCLPWLLAAAASAQGRVVIVAPDATLLSTLTDALAPWGVVLFAVEASGPGSSMPGSAERGRELADQHDAAAVVWLSESEDGWAVWAYDAGDDRAMARRLPSAPPFDAPTAAAIALTVVTLLRHSAAAPPAERAALPTPAPSPLPEATPPFREVRVETAVRIEGWAVMPDQAEGRVGLALAVWPSSARWLGLGVGASFGTGSGTGGPELAGRHFDGRILVRANARAPIAGPLALGALLGIGARITVLEGGLAGSVIGVGRVVGLVEAALELALELDLVSLLLRSGAAITPWGQRYSVHGGVALETRPIWPWAELTLEIGF